MTSMNYQDDTTRHAYDKWLLEVDQLRWEQDEAQLTLRDGSQAQHAGGGHTHGMAVTADDSLADDVHDVNAHDDDLEHDEWLDELYAREELERAEREREERRCDH